MRSLLDVSFLLALLDERHLQNEHARRWWRKNHQSGWASCPLTENGFLRIVSKSSYPNTMSLTEALNIFDLALREGDHRFWADDVSFSNTKLFDRRNILGPNQLTDIYLLGLAGRNGGRLVTFDRSIPLGAVRGAESHHLEIVAYR